MNREIIDITLSPDAHQAFKAFQQGFDVVAEAKRMHILNKKWWIDIHTGEPLVLDYAERCMLVISELSEAMEGVRKNKMDEHLPAFHNELVECCDALIRLLDMREGYGLNEYPYSYPNIQGIYAFSPVTVSSILTGIVRVVLTILDKLSFDTQSGAAGAIDDAIVRVLFYLFWRGYTGEQIREAYEAKVAYNITRADHQIEARRAADGKKF